MFSHNGRVARRVFLSGDRTRQAKQPRSRLRPSFAQR